MDVIGNLRFLSLGNGELQNAIIERLASDPTAADGRIYYNTTDNEYRFYNGTAWLAFGASGDISSLQTEVNEIEASLGDFVNSDGTFDPTPLNLLGNVAGLSGGSPTSSLMDALTQLDAAISAAATTGGADKLTELTDVSITGAPALNSILVVKDVAGSPQAIFEPRTPTEARNDLVVVGREGDTMTGDLVIDGANLVVENDGSAAAPSIAFGSPADTGLFTGSTTSLGDTVDFVGVAVNGTQVARFEQSGSPEFTRLFVVDEVTVTDGAVITDQNSSAAAPGYTFLGDEDTGMFHDVADNIAFSVAGNEAFRIESDSTLNVAATTDYELLVTSDDDIPNKKYVDDAITAATPALALNDLTDVTLTTPADNAILVYNDGAGQWEDEDGATARASLGLAIGTDVQAYNLTLDQLAALGSVADNQFLVGSGAGTYAFEDPATVRTTLGLDSGGAGDIWVDVAGDTMSGTLNMGGNTISNLADPVAGTDVANKQYVDSLSAGLDPKESVRVATDADEGTYGAGTITGASATVDGVTLAAGDRVLVRAQTDAQQNGIYVVTATTTIWDRAPDHDGTPSNEVSGGNFTFVEQGTTYASTGWVLQGDGVLTLDSDDLVWTQFSAAGIIQPGIGLSQSGNIFNVNLGAGIFESPSDEVGIDLFDPANNAIILTQDGSTRIGPGSPVQGSQLALLIADTSLTQGAPGLSVASTTFNTDSGFTSVQPSETIDVIGGTGITVSVVGSPEQIQIENTAGNQVQNLFETFTGDAGSVTADSATKSLAIVGGTNVTTTIAGSPAVLTIDSPLQNLFATVAGDAGSTTADNATDTVTIAGGTGISTAVTGDTLTITNTDPNVDQNLFATVTGDTGSVTAATTTDSLRIRGGVGIDTTAAAAGGSPEAVEVAVDLNANLTDLQDVTVTSPSVGETLVVDNTGGSPEVAGNFVNKPIYAQSGLRSTSTSHVYNHGLDQQWVTVTVLDNTDQVIIPNSITMTDANNVTVTFGTSIECRIIVMGVSAA